METTVEANNELATGQTAHFTWCTLQEMTVKHQLATFKTSIITLDGTELFYKESKEKMAEVVAFILSEFPRIQRLEITKGKPIRLIKIDSITKHVESFSEDSFDVDQMVHTLLCSGILS
jgi:hypothetical protein